MVFRSGIVTLPCSVETPRKDLNSEPKQHDCINSRSGLFLCQKKSRKCFVLSTGLRMGEERIGGNISHSSGNEHVKIHIKNAEDPACCGYTLQATQLCIWKCQTFYESLLRIIIPKQEWNFSTDGTDALNDVEELSWFAIYYVDSAFLPDSFWERSYYSGPARRSIKPGNRVLTRSYPFGPTTSEIFSDTLSRGIISNVDSKTNSLFLIDARCLPGSEGGGVFMNDLETSNEFSRQLIGMIVAPLCLKNEELVGFTICCSISEIISSFLCECSDMNLFHGKEATETISVLESWMKDLSRMSWSAGRATKPSSEPDVLRVTAGDLWGSGVVVAAKSISDIKAEVYVMTCRHVVKCHLEKNFSPVYLHFDGPVRRYRGRVLFSTAEDSCFDLALISILCEANMVHDLFLDKIHFSLDGGKRKRKDLYTVPHIMKHYYYRKGDPVHVKGHCLFDVPNMSPSISAGVLSAVVKSSYEEFLSTTTQNQRSTNDKIPVLLHSTCTVHKGASGGGLICRRTSKLKGLVINHVRDEERKVSYPNVNFSIPACVFMPAVLKYLKTENKSSLDILNCRSNVIQNIWSLNDEPETIESCNKMFWSKL